jgi:O-antigen/teichoic acid export membrane protein
MAPQAGRSLTSRTLDGLFWTATGSAANVLLQLGVVAILARLLMPSEFGTVAAATSVIGFSHIFMNLGVAPAIVQRRDLTPAHVNTGFTMSVVMGVIIGATVALCAPLIADLYRMPQLTRIMQVLSLIFPIASFGLVAGALLGREMRFKRVALRNITSYIFGYGGVSVTLAFLGFGVWALVLGTLVQTIMQTVQTFTISGQSLRFGWNAQARRDLLSYGVGSTLARVGNYAANQADNIIVGRMLGPASLGIYGRAYQFISMPANLFGTVTDKVLFPAMSRVQHDRAKLERAYRQSLAIIAMVTLPISGLLFVSAPEAVGVLLGDRWSAVIPPFQVLVLGLLFRTSYKMSDSLARASAATMNRAWRQWIYAGSVIAGALVGTRYGIVGVAAGVSLAIILNFLLMLQLSMVLSGVSAKSLLVIHVRHLIVSVITTAAAYGVMIYARDAALPQLLRLIAASTATGATWILLSVITPKLMGDELTWLISILKTRMGKVSTGQG